MDRHSQRCRPTSLTGSIWAIKKTDSTTSSTPFRYFVLFEQANVMPELCEYVYFNTIVGAVVYFDMNCDFTYYVVVGMRITMNDASSPKMFGKRTSTYDNLLFLDHIVQLDILFDEYNQCIGIKFISSVGSLYISQKSSDIMNVISTTKLLTYTLEKKRDESSLPAFESVIALADQTENVICSCFANMHILLYLHSNYHLIGILPNFEMDENRRVQFSMYTSWGVEVRYDTMCYCDLRNEDNNKK